MKMLPYRSLGSLLTQTLELRSEVSFLVLLPLNLRLDIRGTLP